MQWRERDKQNSFFCKKNQLKTTTNLRLDSRIVELRLLAPVSLYHLKTSNKWQFKLTGVPEKADSVNGKLDNGFAEIDQIMKHIWLKSDKNAVSV